MIGAGFFWQNKSSTALCKSMTTDSWSRSFSRASGPTRLIAPMAVLCSLRIGTAMHIRPSSNSPQSVPYPTLRIFSSSSNNDGQSVMVNSVNRLRLQPMYFSRYFFGEKARIHLPLAEQWLAAGIPREGIMLRTEFEAFSCNIVTCFGVFLSCASGIETCTHSPYFSERNNVRGRIWRMS